MKAEFRCDVEQRRTVEPHPTARRLTEIEFRILSMDERWAQGETLQVGRAVRGASPLRPVFGAA